MQQNAAGIGCPKFQREAEDRIRELLAGRGVASFSAIATDILAAVPMRLKQIKSLVNDLKKRDVVALDLPPRKQKPQLTTRISLGSRGA